MKTILVIDGADNCAYDCFRTTDEFFKVLFPAEGQDIDFIEDFIQRCGDRSYDDEFNQLWNSPIRKKDVSGIDGILFYELLHKKEFYPNKMDSDLDERGRSRPRRE